MTELSDVRGLCRDGTHILCFSVALKQITGRSLGRFLLQCENMDTACPYLLEL